MDWLTRVRGSRRFRGDETVVTDPDGLSGPLDVGTLGSLSPSRSPRPTERRRQKLGRASRYPLTILTLVFTINVTHQFVLPGVFPLVKEEFRLSDTALGVLGSGYLLSASLGLVPFAILADRYSRTKIIAWASLGWGALMTLMGAAGSYAQLLAVRLGLGVTDPAELPTSYSLLTDYYPVEERGRVFGIWNIGQLMGVVLVPVAGAIADAFGWRAALYSFAIPGFVIGILAWRLPEPERGIQDRLYRARRRAAEGEDAEPVDIARRPGGAGVADDDAAEEAVDEAVEEAAEEEVLEGPALAPPRLASWAAVLDALRGYATLLRIPTVLVALFGVGLASFFTRGLGVWLTVFFVRFHDMSISQATGSVAILAFGALIGSIGGGYLSDHLEARGMRLARVRIAGGSGVISAAFLFPAFATDDTTLMLLLFFVGAIFVFPPQPLLQAVMANVVDPALRGRGSSLDALTQTVLGASSVFIYGVLSDAVGLRTTLLTVVPFLAVMGVTVWILGSVFQLRDEGRMHARLDERLAEAEEGTAVSS